MDDKTRRAVTDALNGDIDKVDAAVRRALYTVSTELDEHAHASKAAHIEIMEMLQANNTRLEARVSKVQTLLISATLTFVLSLATGLLNLVLN